VRVIAGTARGAKLVAPRGQAVRPTSGRLREAIFSSIGEQLIGARLWDVCAGTGAIGIEALSRGASSALFSEPSASAVKALRHNLAAAKVEERATVVHATWQDALDRCARRAERFDVVYFDPPWAEAAIGRFCGAVRELLVPGSLVLIEHPAGADLAVDDRLERRRTVRASAAAVTIFSPRAH